jgi:hypothetical protein
MTDDKALWAALCAPFSDEEIELLPKYTGPMTERNGRKVPANNKESCRECGGYHANPSIHLSYVGHAGLTMRLNDVVGQAGWDWEPMALTPTGTPAMSDGGMWIRMTILGVTKLGFGDSQGKTGPNATKEIIGDAMRNAAMRHGIGTYLWGKSDKARNTLVRGIAGVEDDEPPAPAVPPEATKPEAAPAEPDHIKDAYKLLMDAAKKNGNADRVKTFLLIDGKPATTGEEALSAFRAMTDDQRKTLYDLATAAD